MLGVKGIVRVELPTLRQQAAMAARELWYLLASEEAVMWLDNWYFERYSPDPQRPVRSLNVTAFGILFLHSTEDTPASRTRRRSLGRFTGHPDPSTVSSNVDSRATDADTAFAKLGRKVAQLLDEDRTYGDIRVPLDVVRSDRPRRQWRTLSLSENRVGTAVELVGVLGEVVEYQRRAGAILPLLVDEKIHYSIMKMLYSSTYAHLAGRAYLRQVPLVYAAWHPYKYTLTLVYRAFLPVFALLESTGIPRVGEELRHCRKVVYMEKMVAALLYLPQQVRDDVEVAAASAPNHHALP